MSETEPPPTGDPSPSPFASKWFVVAAIVVGLVVVMGVVVTVVRLTEDEDADPEQSEGQISEEEYPDEATQVPRSDDSDSTCGLQPSEGSEFAEWPGDIAWEPVGTLEAPSSTAHGPGETEQESGYRHCYAKSPTGAVVAATNYVAMTTDPMVVHDLIGDMYAEGEGKEAAQERLEEEGAEGSESGTAGHIGGVRLLSYGVDRARVDVALVIEDEVEGIGANTIDLRWEDGDWKIVTRADGEMVIPRTVIESLDGYVLTPEEE